MELTEKQNQILSLAARGLKDKLIADSMGISVRTVQNHLARIYTKTHTTNRIGAIMLYMNTKVAVVKRATKAKKANSKQQ